MNKVGRILTEPEGLPVNVLFVYNCNPVAILPDQRRVIRGLEREDLFTVVFDQVLTDTAAYADVVLPATTFLEHYDFARGYGPITLQLGKPVIDAVGESRIEHRRVHGSRAAARSDDRRRSRRRARSDAERARPAAAAGRRRPARALDGEAAAWRPPDPVRRRVPEDRRSQGRSVPRRCSTSRRRWGSTAISPIPATAEYPLALISPASERTISSTLGELKRPEVRLEMNPADADARGIEDGDPIRVWNALGEMRINARLSELVKSGIVTMPKGVWRRSTKQRLHVERAGAGYAVGSWRRARASTTHACRSKKWRASEKFEGGIFQLLTSLSVTPFGVSLRYRRKLSPSTAARLSALAAGATRFFC